MYIRPFTNTREKIILLPTTTLLGIPGRAQLVKNPPAKQETPVRLLGCEDPLEKEIATHSQYSCLESPMARGVQLSVHGVKKELDTTDRPSISTLLQRTVAKFILFSLLKIYLGNEEQ